MNERRQELYWMVMVGRLASFGCCWWWWWRWRYPHITPKMMLWKRRCLSMIISEEVVAVIVNVGWNKKFLMKDTPKQEGNRLARATITPKILFENKRTKLNPFCTMNGRKSKEKKNNNNEWLVWGTSSTGRTNGWRIHKASNETKTKKKKTSKRYWPIINGH